MCGEHESIEDLKIVLNEGVVEIVARQEFIEILIDEGESDFLVGVAVDQIILSLFRIVVTGCRLSFRVLMRHFDCHMLIFCLYLAELLS